MIINDLVPAVRSKLRGRTDKDSSIPYYIAQALIDLSTNYEFEELKQTGPLTNFVVNIAEYPTKGYDPSGINGNPFVLSVDDRITFIRSWFTYFDTNGMVNVGYEQILQSLGDSSLTSKIAASKVYMPRDWIEIVILAAAEKACYDIGMNEIGMSYHQQLYGYKDKKGSEYPGIITVKISQQDRQTSFNSRAMRPVVRRYT